MELILDKIIKSRALLLIAAAHLGSFASFASAAYNWTTTRRDCPLGINGPSALEAQIHSRLIAAKFGV
jgi:hypothetical protein